MKKVYGITNPKKIDYLFSMLVALVAVTALWVGIWIAATKSFENANLSFDFFEKAIKFDLNDANYMIVLLQSSVLYGGFAYALAMLVLALAKKKFRAIWGAFGIALAGLTISLEIGFVNVYANQTVSQVAGVFAVVLAILCIATAVFTYSMSKFTCKLIVCDKLYDSEFQKESNGLLKDKEKEIVGLSKSEAVYDAIHDKKVQPKSKKKQIEKLEEKKQEVIKEEKEEKLAKVEEQKPEIIEQEELDEENDLAKEDTDANSPFGIKANHYTFEQKLKIAKPVARKYFKDIKAYFEEIGFKSALTKSGETFSHKNTKFAVITTAGKSGLKIYFKLSPANYEDSTLPFKDVSDKKKYEKTPLMFVVKSDLAVRRAKALMDDIKKEIDNEEK